MADEFMKGLFVLTGGALAWLVLSGWYTTESFEEGQLVADVTVSQIDIYATVALTLREALFWFAIIGALTFWVLIPAAREARSAWASRRSSD
ncbi:hypothetical protein BRD01_15365 [Halobacteriales archaeon QS_8_65_32]|jgi:hypothetical protein|nr:MAG: hypothetical protein BRD01_15365 [Halobacteriales archaeon QS_8_65_32]